MSIELWTLVIAVVTSIVCALSGSLLLVSRKSMVSEGLSHAVLPGLVIAFMIFRDYSSPWLILSAAASGLLMVWLTHLLQKTGLVDDDAGLGIVFSGMFSVGVLIVSRSLRNTHFHADCIIDGNLALAPLDRLEVGGFDLGPRSWLVMSGMLIVVLCYIVLFYKELKLALFDSLLACRFRLRPALLQFLTLAVISLTTVCAFNVAGSILIVALMIAPAASAYLLTNRLGSLLMIASAVATLSALLGHLMARSLNIAPTGPMASAAGLIFLLILVLAPRKGLAQQWKRRRKFSSELDEKLVLEIMQQQPSTRLSQLAQDLNWSEKRLSQLVVRLQSAGRLKLQGEVLTAS